MDDGWFGPDSVSWRVHADRVSLIGGMRALIIQALEPRAMAGVDQHSKYREDPWGRLARTSEFVLATTFGGAAAAEAACERVRKVHEHVRGVDPVTGRAYTASDPDLLLWIHAVEVDSFVVAYRAYAGRLSDADADRYCVEMARVAEAVELPVGMAPTTMAELEHYLAGVEGLQVTPAARDGLRTILFPPMRMRFVPVWVACQAAALAILPRWVRDMYGMSWPSAAYYPVRANTFLLTRALNVLLPPGPTVRAARARVRASVNQ